jgi:hypothetical protein
VAAATETWSPATYGWSVRVPAMGPVEKTLLVSRTFNATKPYESADSAFSRQVGGVEMTFAPLTVNGVAVPPP